MTASPYTSWYVLRDPWHVRICGFVRQTTTCTDTEWMTKPRRWFAARVETRRQYRRLVLIDDYNHFMDGVDLQDQLRWYYRPDGKRMWRSQVKCRAPTTRTIHAHAPRTQKWTWAVFLFVLNTAVVQAYITHTMILRDGIAHWDIQFNT